MTLTAEHRGPCPPTQFPGAGPPAFLRTGTETFPLTLFCRQPGTRDQGQLSGAWWTGTLGPGALSASQGWGARRGSAPPAPPRPSGAVPEIWGVCVFAVRLAFPGSRPQGEPSARLCPEPGLRKPPATCSEAPGVRWGRLRGPPGPERCWDSVVSRSALPGLSTQAAEGRFRGFWSVQRAESAGAPAGRPALLRLPRQQLIPRPPAPLPSQPPPETRPSAARRGVPGPARPARLRVGPAAAGPPCATLHRFWYSGGAAGSFTMFQGAGCGTVFWPFN